MCVNLGNSVILSDIVELIFEFVFFFFAAFLYFLLLDDIFKE